MTTTWQDLVYGFRMLVRKPGFTIIASLSLSVGIGANTVIFSLINTTLLRPLNFRDPARLSAIWTVPQHPNQRITSNLSAYLAWKERSRWFESMGAYSFFSSDLGPEENGAPAEKINGQYITSSLIETLGVKPVLGRVPTAQESNIGDPAQVILISNRLWPGPFAPVFQDLLPFTSAFCCCPPNTGCANVISSREDFASKLIVRVSLARSRRGHSLPATHYSEKALRIFKQAFGQKRRALPIKI